jgi:hypothetical protein
VLIGVEFEEGQTYFMTEYKNLFQFAIRYADCEPNLYVCLSKLLG